MTQTTTPPANRKSRRWIVRAILVLLLIVLLVPVGYWGWGVYQHHLLNQLIAQLHATGEPVLPEDFNGTSGDSPDNPVPELRAAAETLPHDLDLEESAADERELQKWSSMLDAEFPLTAAESNTIREICAGHAAALSHVDAAMQKTGGADWRIRFESPVIQKRLTDLNRQRTLAKLLKLAVMNEHQRGDDAEAIKRVQEMLLVSRSLYHSPFLVGHLVAVGTSALAVDSLERITPDLRIDTGSHRTGCANPREIRSLLAELLDDHDQRAGIQYELRTERMLGVDSALWAAKGRGDPQKRGDGSESLAAFALRPLALRDARLLIKTNSQVAAAARFKTWPECAKALPPLDELTTPWEARLHPLYSILLPSYRRAMQQDFRLTTLRRMHAVALAIRWYAVEHGGVRPTNLAELVPTYLPEIPRDPFATNAPLRYKAGADPIVYSVGENGTDEAGSELANNPEAYSPGRSVNLWDQQDITLHLNHRPREHKDENDRPVDSISAAATTRPSRTN